MAFTLFLVLFASTTIAYSDAIFMIVYGDVHKDVEFFTRTYPWIVDNIGGNLYVEYYLLGSGRYSVSQSCALKELRGNTFLQAQYLRCEAKGYPSEYCLCDAGVDPENFKQCVVSGGSIAGEASTRFSTLGINHTPLVDLEGRNSTFYGFDDVSLLEKICSVYFFPPRGCTYYSNQTEGFLEQKAVAQFDRACFNEFPFEVEKPEEPTTFLPTDTAP